MTASTPATPAFLTLDIADVTGIRVLATESSQGNIYFTLRKADAKPSRSGMELPPLTADGALPTEVTVDGLVIPLTLGLTTDKTRDEAGVEVVIPESERRPRAVGSLNAVIPSLGEPRRIDVQISVRKDGGWQVKVNVWRGSSASPESARTRQQANLKSLLALMGVA